MRVLFVNENIGGHATMHAGVRAALAAHPTVQADFFDTPPRALWHRLLSAPVPGLARFDLDLHPLRDQLARSATVRRHVIRRLPQYDVVHVYTQNAGLLLAPALRRMPSVVSTDATNALNAFRLPQRHPTRFTPLTVRATVPIERRVLRAATMIGSHSQWAADSMVADYGVRADDIRIIPFGLTMPAAALRHAEDTPPRVVFIGRSMDRKGGWRLLDIWRRELRDRCHLTLVTHEDVPAEPGLEVIRTIRPGDDRLAALLSSAAVFALPTELDTFSYAAIEAMACGVPVVATRTAGIPEVVSDRETGLLVDPGDDRAFAAAIGRLLDHPELREQMGRAGRARAHERFDAVVTTAALVDLLREAVHRGPRR